MQNILFDPHDQMDCPYCGEKIPVSTAPPFKRILCPHCRHALQVPGWFGPYTLKDHLPFFDLDDEVVRQRKKTGAPPDPREFRPDLTPEFAELIRMMLHRDIQKRPADYPELFVIFTRQQSVTPPPILSSPTIQSLQLGGLMDRELSFTGHMAELHLYRRALSPDQLDLLFHQLEQAYGTIP